MPELPEVETVVRQLDAVLPGKVIESVKVLRDKSFVGREEQLVGLTIQRITRKQKIIIIELADSDLLVLVHLKMTGQLILDQSKSAGKIDLLTTGSSHPTNSGSQDDRVKSRIVGGHPTPDWVEALPSKHTRVVFHFTDQSVLYFNDMRVFGWVKVVTRGEWLGVSEKLPPDVIDSKFTLKYLQKVLSKFSRAIKLVILDQSKMGGMGNIYANDALWLAKINPSKAANQLTKVEIKALHSAMVKVLQRGIELGGASESTYKHINGMGGTYQEEFLIYKQAGEKCRRCGGIIKKYTLGGRGTYVCPGCQA